MRLLFLFIMFPVWSFARDGKDRVGFGAVWTGFSAPLLNNSGTLSGRSGSGAGLFYLFRPERTLSFSAAVSAGMLNDASAGEGLWNSSRYLGLDANACFLPQALFVKKEKRSFRVPVWAGYSLHYSGAYGVHVSAGYGAGIQKDFRNFGINTTFMHHQQLGGDFRTFLSFRLGLSVPF